MGVVKIQNRYTLSKPLLFPYVCFTAAPIVVNSPHSVVACDAVGVDNALDWLTTDGTMNRDSTVLPLLDQNGVDLRLAFRAHNRSRSGILTEFAIYGLWLHEKSIPRLEGKTTGPLVSFNCR